MFFFGYFLFCYRVLFDSAYEKTLCPNPNYKNNHGLFILHDIGYFVLAIMSILSANS